MDASPRANLLSHLLSPAPGWGHDALLTGLGPMNPLLDRCSDRLEHPGWHGFPHSLLSRSVTLLSMQNTCSRSMLTNHPGDSANHGRSRSEGLGGVCVFLFGGVWIQTPRPAGSADRCLQPLVLGVCPQTANGICCMVMCGYPVSCISFSRRSMVCLFVQYVCVHRGQPLSVHTSAPRGWLTQSEVRGRAAFNTDDRYKYIAEITCPK